MPEGLEAISSGANCGSIASDCEMITALETAETSVPTTNFSAVQHLLEVE
jgi:hypothetical protein